MAKARADVRTVGFWSNSYRQDELRKWIKLHLDQTDVCARTLAGFVGGWKRRPTAWQSLFGDEASVLDAPAKPGERFYEHEPPWRPRFLTSEE